MFTDIYMLFILFTLIDSMLSSVYPFPRLSFLPPLPFLTINETANFIGGFTFSILL